MARWRTFRGKTSTKRRSRRNHSNFGCEDSTRLVDFPGERFLVGPAPLPDGARSEEPLVDSFLECFDIDWRRFVPIEIFQRLVEQLFELTRYPIAMTVEPRDPSGECRSA